jgi:hypothetical protein
MNVKNQNSGLSEILIISFAICLAIFLSACSKEKLSPLEHLFIAPPVERTSVDVNFCTDPSQVVNSKLKYIVVLDHSASNINNYKIDPTTGGPLLLPSGALDVRTEFGTDPLKNSRYGDVAIPGTLLNFLANTPDNDPADPSVYFSLFTFSGSFNQWPTNNTFTSNVQAFEDRVAWVKANFADQGSTNYLDVLRGVQSLIQADINSARTCSAMSVTASPTAACPKPGRFVSSSYVIVFMSDGSPIVSVSLNPLSVNRQPSRDVLGTVASIMGLQANSRFVDSINLFTVYYYQPANPDPFAAKLLQDMATLGNGVSYNVVSSSNIDYRRFTVPSRLIKFSLADIFVTNASITLSKEGGALLDTDMDGLDDAKEQSLGSAIDKADSDGNGVGDLVEVSVNNGKPCGEQNSAGQCSQGPATVSYRTGVCAALPNTSSGGVTTFRSSDPSGMNDCEKIVLNNAGGINNPDSNADFIPDWLQFKNGVPFQIGTRSARDTQDLDGVSYYQKIKTSLPALTPYYSITNAKPSTYDMEIISNSATQDCYKLSVLDLPISGDNNMVQVDVVLSSQLLQDRFLYRQGRKRFSGASRKLTFYDWQDSTEQANETWRSWP